MIKGKKSIACIILLSLLLSLFSDIPLPKRAMASGNQVTLPNGSIAILPQGVTESTRVRGYGINLDVMMKDRILVFGTNDKSFLNSINPRSVDRPNANNNYEYRYIGYDLNGSLHTNPNFPPDVDSPKMPWERDIVYQPWKKGLLGPGISENNLAWSHPKESEELIKKILQKYNFPSKGMSERELIKYYLERYYIQALPSPGLTGSVRQFHRLDNGEIWYQTLTYEQPIQIIEKHSVKADFDLKNEVYEYQNVGYKDISTAENSHITYRRLTIDGDGYFAKVENSKSPDIRLKKGIYTFTLYVENNLGDNDTMSKTIEVIEQEIEVNNGPIAIVIAPETAVINEAFNVSAKASMASTGAKIVEYKWYIGDSPTSLQYVAEYDNFDEINVSYPIPGTKYFQVKIKDTKNAEAVSNVASTNIIDDTPTSVTAKVDVPDTVYEGVFFPVSTFGSKVMYGDENMSVRMAVDKNIATYNYNLSCSYTGRLDPDGGDIYVEELGQQTIKYRVRTRDARDEDVDTFNVLPTPQTQFFVSGVRKENRRLVIDTTSTIHHVKYPIDHDRTVINIKDMQTGETATIKKSSSTDRTYIKTTRLTDDGIAEWTAKRPGNYDIEVTTYDSRGKSSTLVKTIKVEKDLPPEANIVSLDVVYRDTSGKATIKVTKNPVSRDSDHIDIERIEYRYDKNNNGSLDDEAFMLLPAGTETVEVSLKKVGKVEFKYYVRETFDHIPSHVTDSDFLSDTQIKIITVDNIAPITSFDVIKKSEVDILAFADESIYSTAKNKTEGLKENLNSDSNILVDVVGDTEIVDTSDEVITDAASRTFSNTFPSSYNELLASNEDVFIFRGNNYNTLFWVRWDNLAEVKSLPYNTYDEYNVIEYISSNKKFQRLFARKGNTIYELDITTGEICFSVELERLTSTWGIKLIDENIVISGFARYNRNRQNDYTYFSHEVEYESGSIIKSREHEITSAYYGVSIIGEDGNNLLFLVPKQGSFEIYKTNSSGELNLVNKINDGNTLDDKLRDRPTYRSVTYNDKIYLFYHYYNREVRRDKYTWKDYIYVLDRDGQLLQKELIDEGGPNSYDYGIVDRMELLDINDTGIYLSYDTPGYSRYRDLLKYDVNTLQLVYRIIPKNQVQSNGSLINVGGYNPNGYVAYVGTGRSSGSSYLNYQRYSLRDGSLVTDEFEMERDGSGSSATYIKTYNDANNRFQVLDMRGWHDITVFVDVINDLVRKRKNEIGPIHFAIQIDDHRVVALHRNGIAYLYNFDSDELVRKDLSGYGDSWIVSPDLKHFVTLESYSSDNRTWFWSYKINKGFMGLMEDLEKYEKRSESNFYIPIITKDIINITESDINKLINRVKELKGKFLFLGSNNNSAIGQRLASSTGGMFATYTTLDDAYSKINDFIKNDVGAKEKNKTIYVRKGEEIYYNKYYVDYEGDPVYQPSGERWKYSQDLSYPRPDGIIPDNNKWLTAPKKFIDKVGRFLVSFIQQDNPPPGNTAYESYRKWSNENPMEIIVYEGERPPEVNVPPKIDIKIAGDLRENHRVDFIITALKGSKDIKWSSLDISFNTSDYLPYAKPTTAKFSRVFKNKGEHRITVKISDIEGTQAVNTVAFNINPDLPPVAGFKVEGDGKRNESGVANFVINNISKTTDDPIGEIKYFIEDVSYQDDGNGKMIPIGNAFYPLDIPEDGKLEIEKIGESNIKQVVTDYYINGIGLNGEDLDQYRKFKTAEAINVLTVNNEPPQLEYSVAPNVIVVGDKVSHNTIITDDTPTGDYAKYMFVHNELYFDNSQGKHDLADITTEDPTEILDKKGLYMFYAVAVDEDGAYSEWVLGGQVKVVSEPVSDFTIIAKPENNEGENRQFEDDFFKKGSVVTVQNKSFSEDYTSAINKGIAYYKLEFRDVADPDWTLITEQSNLTGYIHETDLPRINDRGIYEIRQTVRTPEGIEAVATKHFTMLELRMEAELEPDRIYPTQSYKIKATLSQDGQGAVAYIDYLDQWVTLDKVDEDADNKYYEISITTVETMPDGQYPIKVYGLYPFNNELERDLILTVDTPIDMSSDLIPLGPNQFNTNYILQNNSPDSDYIKSAFSESIKVIVNLTSPITIDRVTAKLSNGEPINLAYNHVTGAWEGIYNIYRDTAGDYIKDKDFYGYSIEATAVNGSKAVNNHRVWVYTPVDLNPLLDTYLSVGAEYNIAAITSKYADSVNVTMFEGSPYEAHFSLTGSTGIDNHINWGRKYTIPAIPEGSYKVRYTGRTLNGTVESKVLDVNILELTVEGSVHHTDKWNENRIKYNLSKTNDPNSPRPYNVFFPGEKFILKAETNPGAQADKVDVNILGTPYSTTLINAVGDIWEGELWHEDMLYWNNRTLTFRFTAYKSGVSDQDDVIVYIVKDNYWRQHRLF